MKIREHATAIVLFVVAVGLVVYAYEDRENVTDVERSAREGDLFPAWRREKVDRIELVHDGETTSLEKHGDDGGAGQWWMTAPRNEIADYAAVESLLIALEHGHYVRKSNAEGSPFDAPRVRGTIHMGGVTFEFALGKAAPSPDGASYFALKGGESGVVGKELATELLLGADHFRSHAVVPYLSIQLDSLQIVTPRESWSLARKSPIAFDIEPLGVRASRTRLDRVWGALGDMRAESFLKDEDAKRLTENPRITITMKAAEGATRSTSKKKSDAPVVMRVGGSCAGLPGQAGREDDVVFYRARANDEPAVGACVPKGVLAALEIPADSLADEGAFTARADEIDEVQLESGDTKIDLARMGNGFHERSPEDRNIAGKESDGISHLIAVLAACEGARFVRGATADGPVLGRVKIHGADGDEEIEVGKNYFRRLADNAIVVAPERLTTQMLPHASLFRDLRVFTPELGDARVDRITLSCGNFQAFEHRADRWSLSSPREGGSDHGPPGSRFPAPDDAALAGFADAFFRIHAQAWVADADDGAFGTLASKCGATLVIAAEGGARTIALTLGDEADGGIFARASTGPNVMLLPLAVRDLISAIYMDRDVARARGDISRITITQVTRGGAATVLARGDETRDAFEEADALSFDKVVRYGAAQPADALDPPRAKIGIETVTDGGASTTKTISFGAKIGNMYIARVDGTAAIYGVSVNRVRALVPDSDAQSAMDAGALHDGHGALESHDPHDGRAP